VTKWRARPWTRPIRRALRYHTQVFGALGFGAEEAAMRAFMLYSYEVAESVLNRQGTAAQKQARSAFVERLMLQPLQA
jgi:hypothetical protein